MKLALTFLLIINLFSLGYYTLVENQAAVQARCSALLHPAEVGQRHYDKVQAQAEGRADIRMALTAVNTLVSVVLLSFFRRKVLRVHVKYTCVLLLLLSCAQPVLLFWREVLDGTIHSYTFEKTYSGIGTPTFEFYRLESSEVFQFFVLNSFINLGIGFVSMAGYSAMRENSWSTPSAVDSSPKKIQPFRPPFSLNP